MMIKVFESNKENLKTGKYKINLGNGNKRLSIADTEMGMEILQKRYPTSTIKSAGGGDYLCFTSDNGKKIGRIRYTCYYVE